MGHYEYKVLPAPRRAVRAKGVKGEPARFAQAVADAMNTEAADGWEYFKSETLPMEAKTGMFKGREETFQTLLVFRRKLEDERGEIISVTPALATAAPAVALATVAEVEDEITEESLDAALDEVLNAADEGVEFDEGNRDPLRNLVDDHRKNTISE